MRILIAARNRTVAVEDGYLIEPTGAFDLTLRFPEADVRPGLINAHDHLHRNHYGRLGRPPYRNAYDWACDIQARDRMRIEEGQRTPRREALLAGAWKNLFAGVTTVVHHDPWEDDFDRDFPVRVPRVRSVDSLGTSHTLDVEGDGPFCVHLAEGIDVPAAEEIRRIDALGLLDADLIAAHGVGMDADGIARFEAAGAALIWCPTSNLFLFGRTAPAALLRGDTDVLLGSDSLLTGVGDLLDELRCARALNLLEDGRLEASVSSVAARRLGLAEPSLEPGAAADLVVLARPLLDAGAKDVLFVMVAGTPRVTRADIVPQLNGFAGKGRERTIGSVVRWTNSNSLHNSRREIV
jgi:hypothetical protein